MSGQAKDDRTFAEKASDYFVNDGPKLVFIILWFIANVAVFFERYYYYQNPNTEALEIVVNQLGHGVAMARGAAAALKLNCALILMTVLRNFLSWLRGTCLGDYFPIDKNIIFHRYIAWTIAFFSGVHICAHFFNFRNIVRGARDNDEFRETLNQSEDVTERDLAFSTLPGSTGHIVTLCMIFMYSSAVKYIRGPMFNVFWFTHHLFIIFYGILMFHGAAAILEPPNFYMWTLGPFFLYTVERVIRVMRGKQDTILQLAVAHPSKVLELQMRKSTFDYKPGQYLFLNCPYIAKHEWHPFTITSAPEEDFVSVHIRIVGDWTGDLYSFLNPDKKLGVIQENLLSAPDGSPIFKIDGPFGAASEEVFDFKTVMLCGGGIGVTPFGSILKSIRYKIEIHGQTTIQKAYFFWINRDKTAFEWFSDLLAALEGENINGFLEIHTYLTGQLSVDEIRNVMYGLDEETDQITGLQSPTHFGRPNWDEIFKRLATLHEGEEVGVFFCGPSVLSRQLYKNCRKFTNTRIGTKFVYHKENF